MLFCLKENLEALTRLVGAEILMTHTFTIFTMHVQEIRLRGTAHFWTILGS